LIEEEGHFACHSFENAAETLLPQAVNRSQLRKMVRNGAFLWIQSGPKHKPNSGPHRAATWPKNQNSNAASSSSGPCSRETLDCRVRPDNDEWVDPIEQLQATNPRPLPKCRIELLSSLQSRNPRFAVRRGTPPGRRMTKG
jgi:hypothetical protein